MPREWSARIRSARSVVLLRPYVRPDSSSPSVTSGRIWSVSNTDVVPCRIAASRLRPSPVSMFCAGSGVSVPDRVLVVLHEHEVPVLQEALAVGAGQLVGAAELEPAVEVELAARAARSGRAGLPEVVLAAERDDPLARDADRQPGLDRLLVGAEAELVVALEDRDPDLLGVEPEAVEREVPRELDRALLEVVADREVAEHLEEREVPVGAADVVDVDGAEALLRGRQPLGRRRLLPEEVRLERMHARADQQRRGIVARHERRRGQPLVAPLGEVGEEALADLVGRHAAGESRLGRPVPAPVSRRPASSTRTAGSACTRTGSSARTGRPASTPGSRSRRRR